MHEEANSRDADLDALKQAREMVDALCKSKGEPGRREWMMSIPANDARDPDLVIGRALSALACLLNPTRAPAVYTANEEKIVALCKAACVDVDHCGGNAVSCVAQLADTLQQVGWQLEAARENTRALQAQVASLTADLALVVKHLVELDEGETFADGVVIVAQQIDRMKSENARLSERLHAVARALVVT